MKINTKCLKPQSKNKFCQNCDGAATCRPLPRWWGSAFLRRRCSSERLRFRSTWSSSSSYFLPRQGAGPRTLKKKKENDNDDNHNRTCLTTEFKFIFKIIPSQLKAITAFYLRNRDWILPNQNSCSKHPVYWSQHRPNDSRCTFPWSTGQRSTVSEASNSWFRWPCWAGHRCTLERGTFYLFNSPFVFSSLSYVVRVHWFI